MNNYSYENLHKQLHTGHVYRRDMLRPFSKALDRDLQTLIAKGLLKKLAAGLYYKPAESEFGSLPPQDEELVRCFLRDDHFLLYSWNQYNALGVGTTQLYSRVVVLNCKRHGAFKLGNKVFQFYMTNKDFPKKVTPEFLLVDLVNNLAELAEDTSQIKNNILKKINQFNKAELAKIAAAYGKIHTKKFFGVSYLLK